MDEKKKTYLLDVKIKEKTRQSASTMASLHIIGIVANVSLHKISFEKWSFFGKEKGLLSFFIGLEYWGMGSNPEEISMY